MSRGWQYKSGDWWITCDVCSRQILASESKERWDGFRVCKDDWEPRHPQDFIKTKLDKITVPFSRPEPEDTFQVINYTNLYVDDFYLTPQGVEPANLNYIVQE